MKNLLILSLLALFACKKQNSCKGVKIHATYNNSYPYTDFRVVCPPHSKVHQEGDVLMCGKYYICMSVDSYELTSKYEPHECCEPQEDQNYPGKLFVCRY